MRSLVPLLVALACPVAMCLAMLLMRRRGQAVSCTQHSAEKERGEILIDRDGAIAKRFEGPIVASTIRSALGPLLG